MFTLPYLSKPVSVFGQMVAIALLCTTDTVTMKKMLRSDIGRLRLLGIFEGSSLIFLVFIAVPMKYLFNNPIGSEIVGPIHGVLFLLFVVYTFTVAANHGWNFFKVTWKILLASIIPVGTFYIDRSFLKHQEK